MFILVIKSEWQEYLMTEENVDFLIGLKFKLPTDNNQQGSLYAAYLGAMLSGTLGQIKVQDQVTARAEQW